MAAAVLVYYQDDSSWITFMLSKETSFWLARTIWLGLRSVALCITMLLGKTKTNVHFTFSPINQSERVLGQSDSKL